MTESRYVSSRVLALLTLLALATGCGGSTATTTTAPQETTVNAQTGTVAVPDARRGRTAESFAPLRPASVADILTRMDRDPEDPDLYSRAAIAYADTPYSGMTLVYAQTYRILSTHGSRTVDTTNAMARIIRDKITVAPNGTDVVMDLAAGEMPTIRNRDGASMAPFVYLYQVLMDRASGLATAQRGTLEGAAAVINQQLVVTCRGDDPLLDEELFHTLCGISAAGHRDTYAHWVVGPAFAAEWEAWQTAHTTGVNQFLSYLAAHPFRPRTPMRADDAYVVR